MEAAHAMFDLAGKSGYVTGAGSGVGREIALGLAAAGAIVVVSDIDEAACGSVVAQIIARGGRALAQRADVARRADVERLVEVATTQTGRLDFAFNNAGVLRLVKPEDLTDQDWQDELSVNLTGVFMCCQAAGRAMIAQGGGKIVNTASISGMVVNSGLTYSSAKAGVIQMTRVLAYRWAKHRVYVNCISPGYVRTPMIATHLQREDVEKEMLRQTPLRRLAEPRDLIGPAVFLASAASDYVTGHNLVVDGGVTLA